MNNYSISSTKVLKQPARVKASPHFSRATSKRWVWVSFFWIMPRIVYISGRFKMVYIDGAYDSKA